MDKHRLLRYLTDVIYEIINTDSQKCENESSPLEVINNVVVENWWSAQNTAQKKIKNDGDFISIPDQYAIYRDEFVSILESFTSIQYGRLKPTFTLEHRVNLKLTKLVQHICYPTVPRRKLVTLHDLRLIIYCT